MHYGICGVLPDTHMVKNVQVWYCENVVLFMSVNLPNVGINKLYHPTFHWQIIAQSMVKCWLSTQLFGTILLVVIAWLLPNNWVVYYLDPTLEIAQRSNSVRRTILRWVGLALRFLFFFLCLCIRIVLADILSAASESLRASNDIEWDMDFTSGTLNTHLCKFSLIFVSWKSYQNLF